VACTTRAPQQPGRASSSASTGPDDKYCCWAPNDNLVLREDRNPYPWLPYVMFRGQPVPGRFWPHSPVTDGRPRQVDLNKRLSQIGDNASRIGNPPLLRPSRWVTTSSGRACPARSSTTRTRAPRPRSLGSCRSRRWARTSRTTSNESKQPPRDLRPARSHRSERPRRRHRSLSDLAASGTGRHPAWARHRRDGRDDR
jgi:hypothetical protein